MRRSIVAIAIAAYLGVFVASAEVKAVALDAPVQTCLTKKYGSKVATSIKKAKMLNATQKKQVAACTTTSGSNAGTSKSTTAPTLVVSPLDVSHVIAVSKFRSCSGHDFSPGVRGFNGPTAERARSMKHYIQTDLGLTPANSLAVFAPIDGTIDIQEETFPLGKQVYINANGWSVRIFHVDPTVTKGKQVKAGDQIGTIPPFNAADLLGGKADPSGKVPTYEFDIAVTSQDQPAQYVSMFDLMNAQVAQLWAARGFTKENVMISKEARDASPCPLGPDGESFAPNSESASDWVRATGS